MISESKVSLSTDDDRYEKITKKVSISQGSFASEKSQKEETKTHLNVGQKIGKYIVEKELSVSAGQSRVYLVRDSETGTILLMKVYDKDVKATREKVVDSLFRLYLKDEKGLLIRLNENGVIYDYELSSWIEFYEYLDWKTLDEFIKEDAGRIAEKPEKFKEIVSQINSALELLSEEFILHLDLKPSNILIKEENGQIKIKLLDFSSAVYFPSQGNSLAPLSSIYDENTEDLRFHSFTPAYAAPEIFSKMLSRKSDYWSLGLIAYALLTGKELFEGFNERTIQETLAEYVFRDESEEEFRSPFIKDFHNYYSLLLLGLIQKTVDKRWGSEEVKKWIQEDANFLKEQEEILLNDFRTTKRSFELLELEPNQFKSLAAKDFPAERLLPNPIFKNASESVKKVIGDEATTDKELFWLLTLNLMHNGIYPVVYGREIEPGNLWNILNAYMALSNKQNEKNSEVIQSLIDIIRSGKLEKIVDAFYELKEMIDTDSYLSLKWTIKNIQTILLSKNENIFLPLFMSIYEQNHTYPQQILQIRPESFSEFQNIIVRFLGTSSTKDLLDRASELTRRIMIIEPLDTKNFIELSKENLENRVLILKKGSYQIDLSAGPYDIVLLAADNNVELRVKNSRNQKWKVHLVGFKISQGLFIENGSELVLKNCRLESDSEGICCYDSKCEVYLSQIKAGNFGIFAENSDLTIQESSIYCPEGYGIVTEKERKTLINKVEFNVGLLEKLSIDNFEKFFSEIEL